MGTTHNTVLYSYTELFFLSHQKRVRKFNEQVINSVIWFLLASYKSSGRSVRGLASIVLLPYTI